jgi:hypothetical protein
MRSNGRPPPPQPSLEVVRLAAVLERVSEQIFLAVQRDAPPACFNFLLKSQARLLYRLARAAGADVAAEIADTLQSGPPA